MPIVVALGTQFDIGWDMLVAVGTLGLAIFTATLAWSTRSLAQESAADRRAQWRPILVPAHHDVHEPEPGMFEIDIRNAGRGPALGVNGQMRAGKTGGASVPGSENMIMPGDVLRLPFKLIHGETDFWRGYVVTFDVSCVDISEQFHKTTIRASIRKQSDGSKPLRLGSVFVEETGRYLLPVHGSARAKADADRHARRLSSRALARLRQAIERVKRWRARENG